VIMYGGTVRRSVLTWLNFNVATTEGKKFVTAVETWTQRSMRAKI
jgi:hypothetical protein